MADLTNLDTLSSDQIRDGVRAYVNAAEKRLKDRGATRLLSRLVRLHGLLRDFEIDAHEGGHLDSIGGDK